MLVESTCHAIRAEGLSKRFGSVQAVSRVDVAVAPGQALGLLGPNGAGKSTTLKMLLGLIAPDRGEALVFGHPVGSPEARALVGATPQTAGFPEQVSPRELLDYAGARYGVRPRIDDLVAMFGLQKLIDRRVAGFSGGEVRRVALALAFVGAPKLVFLDEPTTGLDTDAQDAFRSVMQAYVKDGGSVVLCSHHWDEVEAICTSISLIDKGETVLSGELEDIRKRTTVNHVSFALPDDVAPPDWLQATRHGRVWRGESTDSDAVARRLTAEAVPFENLTIEPMKLNDLIDRIRREERTA